MKIHLLKHYIRANVFILILQPVIQPVTSDLKLWEWTNRLHKHCHLWSG